MYFFIFVLLICLFIFLYCVYVLGNDDFIFLRKDVTMEGLFNIIFLGSLIGLFTSRLFYGFFYTKTIFLNPLVFALFPYYPGLSLSGAVVGIGAYLVWIKTRKGNLLPLARISDFFSIAFLISLPVGFVGFFISSEEVKIAELGAQAVTYFVLFIIFLKFFLPRLLSGKWKEGAITYLFLICFSIVSLISKVFSKISILEYFKNPENAILILIFIVSLGMFLRLKKGK